MIYFIKSESYVKVGYTSNIKNRYKKYVTENPNKVELLGSINGGFTIEKEIHKKLKEYHHRGEWFVYNNTVSALINRFILEYRDEIEPIVQKRRRDKYKHLKVYNMLRNYATASGLLDIQVHIKAEVCEELGISQSTFSRHITKLIKLNKLTRIASLYQF